jgi:hypothetical protein
MKNTNKQNILKEIKDLKNKSLMLWSGLDYYRYKKLKQSLIELGEK